MAKAGATKIGLVGQQVVLERVLEWLPAGALVKLFT